MAGVIEHGEYWTPNATIALYKVPWDQGYSDVVDWLGTDRDAWFASQPSYAFSSPAAYHRTGSDLRVDAPYPDIYGYNYVVVTNHDLADTSRVPTKFFYFITNASMTNPAVTTLQLQLDVWTTFITTAELGGSFMDRTHLPMVDIDANDNSNIPQTLRRYYSLPDGLDTGPDYVCYDMAAITFQDNNNTLGLGNNDIVAVTSTASLGDAWGTVDNPSLKVANGGIVGGLYSGSSVYLFPTDEFQKFLKYIKDYSWIAQCIVSITVLPAYILSVSDLQTHPQLRVHVNGNTDQSTPYYVTPPPELKGQVQMDFAAGRVDISHIILNGWSTETAKYSDLRKLWGYPYSIVQLDNSSEQVLTLKPERLPGNSSPISYMAEPDPQFARIALYVDGYGRADGYARSGIDCTYRNALSTEQSVHVPCGDFLQSALWITEFPQFTIANNNAILYYANNANRNKQAYANAEYAYNSAFSSAVTANNIARNNIDLQRLSNSLYNKNTENSLNTQQKNAVVSAATGIIGGIGSLATGDGGGDLASAIQSAYTANNDYQLAQATYENNRIQNEQNVNFADTNRALSYKNQVSTLMGNKDNAIQNIEASLKDAQLTPPSTIGQAGGDGFRYAYGLLFNVIVRYERLEDAAIIRAGQFYRRFGYRVNRYMNFPSKLNVCKHFTYYKTVDMQIPEAACDEEYKRILRQTFDNGVTVWGKPAEIGRVDVADNTPDTDNMMGHYYG